MQFPELVTLLSRQLRVLVSSNNASLNWDLRCKVREGLVDFMQLEYPQHLPSLSYRFFLAYLWSELGGRRIDPLK